MQAPAALIQQLLAALLDCEAPNRAAREAALAAVSAARQFLDAAAAQDAADDALLAALVAPAPALPSTYVVHGDTAHWLDAAGLPRCCPVSGTGAVYFGRATDCDGDPRALAALAALTRG